MIGCCLRWGVLRTLLEEIEAHSPQCFQGVKYVGSFTNEITQFTSTKMLVGIALKLEYPSLDDKSIRYILSNWR